MSERNICRELGCPGHCCQDTRQYIPARERKASYPDAKPAPRDILPEDLPDGVYYSHAGYEGTVYFENIRIVGMCPNNEDGNCMIYNNRPSACDNYEVGGDDCNKVREFNLIPLDSIK